MGRAYADFEHRNMVLVSPAEKWRNDFAGVPEKSFGGLFDNPEQFLTNMFQNIGQQAVGQVASGLLQDPKVQQAVGDVGAQKALEATAQKQLELIKLLNKYKMYLLVGGGVAAAALIFWIARRK